MKIVSGKVLSTQSVSLLQAAKTIAAFVSADNGGASQAVATYLKRTSAAFNELVQFHKDHKTANFKIKKSRRADTIKSDQVKVESLDLENGGENKKKKIIPVKVDEDVGRKKEKRKKEGIACNVVEGEEDMKISVVNCEGQKEKEKKKIEVGSGNLKIVDDFGRKKEKKKKTSGGGEIESVDNLGVKEEGNKNKRKSEEIVEGEIGNSSEQSGHKKKKRRRSAGDN